MTLTCGTCGSFRSRQVGCLIRPDGSNSPLRTRLYSVSWWFECDCTRYKFVFTLPGDGGSVAYALVSGSDRKFEVDVSTGLVTTVDYLDYETKTTYLMNVSATDQAPPFHQGFCAVYVTLLNELDEAVAFFSAGYEASLRENIATGTEVVQVQAQSADNLNQLTYRFDPDTSPAALALFKIDSVTVSRGRGQGGGGSPLASLAQDA